MSVTAKTVYIAGNGQQFDKREDAEAYEIAHQFTISVDTGSFDRNFIDYLPKAILNAQALGWKLTPPPDQGP